MSSGNFQNGKIELSTQFRVEKNVDNSKLITLLKDRFGLYCSIYISKKNFYVVLISKESVKLFQDIVSPYILCTLKYKIGLNTHLNYYNRKTNLNNQCPPVPLALSNLGSKAGCIKSGPACRFHPLSPFACDFAKPQAKG